MTSRTAALGQVQPLVRARNVHKSFGSLEVLKGIDLDVLAGEVVVILGPSGSGKSTFLRCINHLERMDRGSIEIGGEQIGYGLRGQRLLKLSQTASQPMMAASDVHPKPFGA